MKKLLSLALVLTMLLSMVPLFSLTVSASSTGYVGDCSWTLDGTQLTISGNGSMGYKTDWPWGKNITELVISEGVTTIGIGAFMDCSKLKTVTLPNTLKIIDKFAFYGCSSLVSITIPENVIEIGISAFSCCSKLIDIVIPKSVNNIGESAFVDCDNLTSITVDPQNMQYCSVDGILFDKNKTTLIRYPNNKKDISYTIPDSVKHIGNDAFSYCRYLEDIKAPDTVVSIGYNAIFYTQYYNNKSNYVDGILYLGKHIIDADENYSSFSLRQDTKVIANGAFATCDNFKELTIPNGVVAIGGSAFSWCGSLEKIYIPKSVKTIGESAFYDCNKLKSIYYSGNAEERRKISLGRYNSELNTVNWHYDACSLSSFHKYNAYNMEIATASKNGSVDKICSVCYQERHETVYYPKVFTLSTTSYTYNGKVRTPRVTVKDTTGKILEKDIDYTVSYPQGRTKVGAYTVKVTMKGNYSGTKNLTFKINPCKSSKLKLSLSTTNYTYNGKSKKPSVTVKNSNGDKLKKDVDYTVEYPKGRKKIGSYKVKIKFKGNYSGTEYLTFKINPGKTSVKKLTAYRKSLRVSIKKKSTHVTGYQIQYSTSKTFKEKYTKSKTIKNYRTTYVTLKSLKAKKTYYVRVRTYKTVDGKKYYSAWSNYKYKKTK